MAEEKVRFQMRIDPDTENCICRLLFKLAVEQDMVMNVLAAGMEISDDTLHALRGRCVQNVKKTNGSVTLDSNEVWRDFFCTELTTGLRRGEICGLMWQDFDEHAGTLKIVRSVNTPKAGVLEIGETKTD